MASVSYELFPDGPTKKVSQQRREGLIRNAESLRRAYEDLLRDSSYRKLLTLTSVASINERIRRMREMLQAVVPAQ